MAARTAACVLFALFLFLLHATATEIEVVGGASRDLAQASAAAEPNNYHYSGGGVAAACYIWKVQPRTFNKYYCKAGLVCCPAKAHPFPKRNAGYGRYTLGVCAKTCETSPPPSSPPPSKGCRGNPTQPANGIFSCGDDKRAGDVCYATCDVNYVGIPSATCTSDLTWGPVQGACYLGVPPLEQGAPSEPAIIEFATGGSGGMGNSGGGGGMGGGGGGGQGGMIVPGGNDFTLFLPSQSFDRRSSKPLAVCHRNPAYPIVGSSSTTCKLFINKKGGGSGWCTAWFVQDDVMVTAGHCIKLNTSRNGAIVPLPEYNVNASNPGVVCCVEKTNTPGFPCALSDAWQVKAWASTTGWFGTEDKNDAAVILVEPYPSNTKSPVLQATKASDGKANIPSRTFFSDGYPGNDTNIEGCTYPQFNGTVRREWATQTSAPLNPSTLQGKDLQYNGSACPGHSGGRVVDKADNKAYGILVVGDSNCTSHNTSTTLATQLVDRALPDGAWLSSLVNAIKIGKPNYKWVTLSDQASCQAACDAIPGTGWRYINGGSPGATWALCASVLDLGPPYGKQWVTGQSYWNQKECRLVDPKSKTSLAVNGSAALTKCACTDCVDTPGSGCSSLFWQPANLAQSCTKPRIANEMGEALYDVYSTICRSVQPGTISSFSGSMGWVYPHMGAPQQCALNNQGAQMVGPVSSFSVWCAAEESSTPKCPNVPVDVTFCEAFPGCRCTPNQLELSGVGVCGSSTGTPSCLPCDMEDKPCPKPYVCKLFQNGLPPTEGKCVDPDVTGK